MFGFALLLALCAVMALSIFLSWPVVYSPRAQGRWAIGLNAAAIGILLFLLADLFADVAPILYPSGYLARPRETAVFAASFAASYLGLAIFDRRLARRGAGSAGRSPTRTAAIIALGIGLQNLTEGLVFGANWTAGTVGILYVVFLGFFLQNVSEGFPIVAPYLGSGAPKRGATIAGLFLLGGLPTILGGAIGYSVSPPIFLVAFDALAIGAIAFVLLPMLRASLRPLATPELSERRDRIVTLGLFVGFLLGLAVNAL